MVKLKEFYQNTFTIIQNHKHALSHGISSLKSTLRSRGAISG
jgi:hypothetical protein